MQHRLKRKPLWSALAVGFTFLFTTVAAPVAEANFWEQRRDASRRANGKASSAGTLYAGLPASLGDIDRVLPAVNGALGNALRAAPPAELNGVETPADRRAAQLPAWLRGLPNSAGEIRRVSLAKNPDTAPVAVLVQDVHDVYSAQTNIARVLAHIQDSAARAKAGPVLVGVEGAHGPFNVKEYRDQIGLPGYDLAAQLLLRTNLIAGPEYLAFTATEEPALWGVETPADYVENVEAYRSARPAQVAAAGSLDAVESAWNRKAAEVLSPRLRALNETLTGYADGKASLIQLMDSLTDSPAAARLAEVRKLNQALALESKIDFQRVEKERAGLIEVLVRKLDPSAVERLIAASLSYRAGRIGFGAYNRELQNLVKSHGISWAHYPSFERYVQYVLVAEDIDKFRLFDEIDTLKKDAVAAAVNTPTEKAMMDLAEDVRLAHRLIRQEFGPAEWRLYVEHRKTAPALNDRVKTVLGAGAPAAPSSAEMARFERFYTAAERRNDSLTANLKARAARMNAKILTMVAGGFHTSELEQRLAKDGFSVVTVTPQIGEVPSGTKYLDIFMVKNVPIEKYLAGDALYLSPPHATTTVPMPGLKDNPKTPGAVRRGMAAAMLALTVMLAGVPAAQEYREKHFQDIDVTVDVNPVSGLPRVHAEDGPTVYGRIGALPYDGSPKGVEFASEGDTQESRVGLLYTAENIAQERSGIVPVLANFLFFSVPRVWTYAGDRVVGVGRSMKTALVQGQSKAGAITAGILLFAASSSAEAGALFASAESLVAVSGFLFFLVAAGMMSWVLLARRRKGERGGVYLGLGVAWDLLLTGFGWVQGALLPNRTRSIALSGTELIKKITIANSTWIAPVKKGEFSAGNVGRFAQAAADVINLGKVGNERVKVLVGFGTRRGAKEYALHLARVLQANGLDVEMTDRPTPATAGSFETQPNAGRSRYAFWVTAGSHPKLSDLKNRVAVNGIKIFKDGFAGSDALSLAIEQKANDAESGSSYRYTRRKVREAKAADRLSNVHNEAFGSPQDWPREIRESLLVDSMNGTVAPFAEGLQKVSAVRAAVNQAPLAKWGAQEVFDEEGSAVAWAPDPFDPRMLGPTVGLLKPGEYAFFFNESGERMSVVEKRPDGMVHYYTPSEIAFMMAYFLGWEKGQPGKIVTTMPRTRWLDRLARLKHPANDEMASLEIVPTGSEEFAMSADGDLLLAADASGHVRYSWGNTVFANSAEANARLLVEIIKEKGRLSSFLETAKKATLQPVYVEEHGRRPNATELAGALAENDFVYVRKTFHGSGNQADTIDLVRGTPAAALFFARTLTQILADRGIALRHVRIDRRDPLGLMIEFAGGGWVMVRRVGDQPIFRVYTEQNSAEAANAVVEATRWVFTFLEGKTLLGSAIDTLEKDIERAYQRNTRNDWQDDAVEVLQHVRDFISDAKATWGRIKNLPPDRLQRRFESMEILRGIRTAIALPQMTYALPPEYGVDLPTALEDLWLDVGRSLENARVGEIKEYMESHPAFMASANKDGVAKAMEAAHFVHRNGRADLEHWRPSVWSAYEDHGEVWSPYLSADLLRDLVLSLGLALDANGQVVPPASVNAAILSHVDKNFGKASDPNKRLEEFVKAEKGVVGDPKAAIAIANAVGVEIKSARDFKALAEQLSHVIWFLKIKELWAAKRAVVTQESFARVLRAVKRLLVEPGVEAVGLPDDVLAMRLVALNLPLSIVLEAAEGGNNRPTFVPAAPKARLKRALELVPMSGGMASRWAASLKALYDTGILKESETRGASRQVAAEWIPGYNGIRLGVDSMAVDGGGRQQHIVSPFTWREIMAEVWRSRSLAGEQGKRVRVLAVPQNPGDGMMLTRKGGPFAFDDEGEIRPMENKVLGHGNVRGLPLAMLDALRAGTPYGFLRAGDGPLSQINSPQLQEIRDRVVWAAEQGRPLVHVSIGNSRSPGQKGGGFVAVNERPDVLDYLIPTEPNAKGFVADRDITMFSTFQNVLNYAAAIYAVSGGVKVEGQDLLTWDQMTAVSALDSDATRDFARRISLLTATQLTEMTERFISLLPSEYVEKSEFVREASSDFYFVQWEQVGGAWHGALADAVRDRRKEEGGTVNHRLTLAYVDISIEETRILSGRDLSRYRGPLPTFAEVKSATGFYSILEDVGLLLASASKRGGFTRKVGAAVRSLVPRRPLGSTGSGVPDGGKKEKGFLLGVGIPFLLVAVSAAALFFSPAALAAPLVSGGDTPFSFFTALADLSPWIWIAAGAVSLGLFAFTARGRRAADTLFRAFDNAPVWVKMLIIATVFYLGSKTVDAALASLGVLGALTLGRRAGPTVYETVGSKLNWDAMVPPVVDPLASLRATGQELAARVANTDRLDALGKSFAAPAGSRGDFEPLFRDPEANNADRGGWVNRPWELNDDPAILESVETEAAGLREKFDRLVVVGMGGESSIVGPDQTADGKTMTVVANTSPEKLQRAAYSLTPAELNRTVFYVISKSGGTTETLANLDLISGLLRSHGFDPKSHIVFVTDPGTGLARRGAKDGIPVKSREYMDRTNTGGRNTLVNFPTLLALSFLRPGAAKAQVNAIVENHAQTPTAADPWVQAANRLSAAMQTGVTKMAVLEPESLRAQLGVWQQQNVEESLGKDGKGLTVYTQAPPLDVLARNANRDWVFVELQIKGRENETTSLAQSYRDAGFEVVTVPVPAGEAAPGAASYGWMKMVAFLGALNDINFSNQPAVESYKSIMEAGNLSLKATEDKARAVDALVSAEGVTVSIDGLLPFLSEAQKQRVGRLLAEQKLSPAAALGLVLADARGFNASLRDLTLSYYEDADPQTAEFLNDLAARTQAATGAAVKWGEGTGVLHGLFVNWFGGPLHQIPVHIVTRYKGDFYGKGSALLQEGAVAAHQALVKAGRPSVLVVVDADLDVAGRRTVGRFFGDVADAMVVADGALASGARDTMDVLGETPMSATTADRYADGVVSGLMASQLALRANLRHQRLADTVGEVAGSFATALFGAEMAARARTGYRQIVDSVKSDAKAQPVAIGGVEAGRAVTRYLDGTSSRAALQDALNTLKRHLAGENSVALGRAGTGLLVVLESELRDGENADLVRDMEALGARHPRVKVQVGDGNDVLGRNENGERVLRVGAAIQLLGVQPLSIDVILPPATSTLVEKSGYEDIVRVLRWILGGVAVEVTSGVEAGIQALVATLKSA